MLWLRREIPELTPYLYQNSVVRALCEYPTSRALILIERDYNGEPAILPVSIKRSGKRIPALHRQSNRAGHACAGGTIEKSPSLDLVRSTAHSSSANRLVDRAKTGADNGAIILGTFGVSVYSFISWCRIVASLGAGDDCAKLRRYLEEW